MNAIARREVELPWRETRVYLIGDTHIGHQCANIRLLQRVIAAASKDSHGYVVGLGDYIDAIRPGDPRFDIAFYDGLTGLDDIVRAQIVKFSAMWKPVSDKTLAFLHGNHEDTIRKKVNRNVYADIADKLSLPKEALFHVGGFLRLHFIDRPSKRGWAVDMFLHHGFGGGRKDGAKINRLADATLGFLADVYAVGHVHSLMMSYHTRVAFDGAQEVLFIVNGHMLDSDCYSYAFDKLYNPNSAGATVLTFNPNKRTIQVDTIRSE